MTVNHETARPGDACPTSRDADSPTGFEVATSILCVRSYDEQGLVDNPEFTNGWEAGVEGKLVHEMPIENGIDGERDRRAYLLGLVSGQVAKQLKYATPFCIEADHDALGEMPSGVDAA